ncbi:MAG: SDR family oxidoreductase [Clostridiales Family XIII bacterium]|jgi:3-oxoacyl-[acyl-carrier protein] reductase|nr:SDR family oxidoreductase [Clostridiales Family XIII bacterium]
MKLEGKVAIITGAGSGVGHASSLLFSQEGAKVVAADLNAETAQKTAAEITAAGGEAISVQADVSSGPAVKNLVDKAIEKFGKVDIIFNCAGLPQKPYLTWELEDDEFEKVMAVNVKSNWLLLKYAGLELKKNHGNIIMVGSTGAIKPRATQALYAAAKGAIFTFVKGAAAELAPEGRANVIHPGPIRTPMLPKFSPDQPQTEEETNAVFAQIAAGTMLGELIEPEDIAKSAVFLASDDAAKITGFSLLVDAGTIIARPRN